jgi:hypothetical protein
MAPSRSRPAVLCAVLATFAASPSRAQPGPAPLSPVPTAQRDIDAWCQKNFPDKCPDFDALLADQETLYGGLTNCVSQSCQFDALFAMDGEVTALNERVLTLMSQVRIGADSCDELSDHKDDFYLMQAGLRKALSAAWAKSLSNPALPPSADSNAAASAEAGICSGNPAGDSCSLAMIVALEAQEFEIINAGCSKTPCPWQESKQLLADFLLLKNNFNKLKCIARDPAAKTSPDQLQALDKTVVAASNIISLTTKGVTYGLDDADKKEKALDQQIAAAMIAVQSGDKSLSPAEVSAMETNLNDVGGNVGSKSLMIDEMNQMMTGEANASGKSMTSVLTTPLRERVNGENEQYVSLQARLKALRVAAGFSFPKNYDEAPAESDPSSIAAPAAAAAKSAPLATPPAPQRPLDKTSIPALPAKPEPPPPILPASVTPSEEVRMLMNPDLAADAQADVLRKSGLTQVVGDPGRRAKLAYPQNSPDTCGLVAEQEVLRAYGRIPATDPAKQQQALRDEVTEAGLFNSGTPADLSGALLERHYLPTKTVYQADIAALNQAVMTGDFIIASVDARPLWNLRKAFDPSIGFDNTHTLAHNILITGALTSKVDGGIVGYYINDSGVWSNNAYFVPAAIFTQAWNGDSRTFVQVLK